MTRFIFLSVSILLLVLAVSLTLKTRNEANQRYMKITSPVFEHSQSIPMKYTCDGENINPPIIFSDVPSDAQSLALIMEDPDVPKNIRPDGMWDHWLIWDMPPTTTEIAEEGKPVGIIGKNSGGEDGYSGPCPPDREHRYFFKLYALNISSLPLVNNTISKKELQEAMKGHILAEAEFIGLYRRQ